jgi:hypothetical protein
MALMAHCSIFGNLSKSILSMVPKHELTLMICSTTTQIKKIINVRKQLFGRSKNS